MNIFTDEARRQIVQAMHSSLGWSLRGGKVVTRDGDTWEDADVWAFLALTSSQSPGGRFLVLGIFSHTKTPVKLNSKTVQRDLQVIGRRGEEMLKKEDGRR